MATPRPARSSSTWARSRSSRWTRTSRSRSCTSTGTRWGTGCGSCPCGLIDHLGEDPVGTAKRELVEEVGLAAADWATLVDVAASPGFTDEVVRIFLARGLSDVERDVLGDEEADLVVRKFPLAEAVRMALAGELVNGATVSGVLAAQAVVTGGAEPRPADAPWRDRPTAFAKRREA